MSLRRRQVLAAGAGLGAAATLAGCASMGAARPHVVVIGGGYSGATAAKYIRLWSGQSIDVTLVEPSAQFISCPLSNLVVGGSRTLADITSSYDGLSRRHGVRLVRDRATAIEPDRRSVLLAGGGRLEYDRLVVSPGIDFMWENLPGMNRPGAQEAVLHAWKAGAQTAALRAQLEAMPDGGVYALTVPLAPYRCPPGPYERASLVASYFKRAKPRSKVLVLDANDDLTSKGPLFRKVWAERYQGILEYRPRHKLLDVDAATRTLKFEFDADVRADVLNVVPDMRAGDIAHRAGLATANRRWCEVDFLTHEARGMPNVHVLGDAVLAAPAMPKSGHMANQHGKTCAAAVVARLTGQPVNPLPIYNNTCYSFVSEREVIHVSSVHRWDAAQKTMLAVPGAGGVSSGPSEIEGEYALGWARNIWADTLG